MAANPNPGNYFEKVLTTTSGDGSYHLIPVAKHGGVSMRVVLTGASNANFRFLASADSTDGTDGDFTIDVVATRSNAGVTENVTGNLSSTPVYSWDANISGYTYVKIVATSGTIGQAKWVVTRQEYADETAPTVAVQSGNITVGGNVNLGMGSDLATSIYASVTAAGSFRRNLV